MDEGDEDEEKKNQGGGQKDDQVICPSGFGWRHRSSSCASTHAPHRGCTQSIPPDPRLQGGCYCQRWTGQSEEDAPDVWEEE